MLVTLVVGIPVVRVAAHLITESWWFATVDYQSVFGTKIACQTILAIIAFLACVGFLNLNYRWAIANHQPSEIAEKYKSTEEIIRTRKLLHLIVMAAILAVGITGGLTVAREWEIVLKSLYATNFGQKDPIFNLDIGFYVLKMPVLEKLVQWLQNLWLAGFVLVLVIYNFVGELAPLQGLDKGLSLKAKRHFCVLFSALALLLSGYFWLGRYEFLYQSHGVVYGAGYSQVYGDIWIDLLLSFMALAIAGLFILAIRRRQWHLPLRGVVVMVGTWLLLHGFYVWFLQHFIVSPNELVKEKPFLAHNIAFTQKAFNLNTVSKLSFEAETELDRAAITRNEPTVSNIRLWDYRPILSSYRQLQEIRLYYKFSDVDVDRYTLKGKYQQVMLSARELATDQLPIEAKTWVNHRLKYTHGYGLAMSPVNQATVDGLPEFYIQDIPPQSNVDLPITEPAIYYGEETKGYIFTGTTTEEFDYPQGETNAFSRYEGAGGVPIPTFWHRLVYAIEMRDLQILTSSYFTNQSRIHDYRQILKRVEHVAPFLHFDSDPYLVILDGKLNWVLDAYTVSDHYPYSESIAHAKNALTFLEGGNTGALLNENINYIRNSVKVVVNAFDGSLIFFAADNTDPVLATYRKIFPHLFTSLDRASDALKAHIRYPEDLFRVQAQMYLTYHMSDPEEFYNREDLWRFPYQTYERSQVLMEPYYMVMPLSQGARPEFVQIQPFTPANKDNMISWLAARVDGSKANLLLYEFPKQKLVYGPRQIEARIDQSPAISQSFTLWSQAGSRVIRGDLLVIPVDQSLLYIEPIYLRAEQGELPELKRVIVAYDKSIVMADNLELALVGIFGSEKPTSAAMKEKGKPANSKTEKSKLAASEKPESPSGEKATELAERNALLAKEALKIFERSQESVRQGEWSDYGRYQEELKKILENLSQNPEASEGGEEKPDSEESGASEVESPNVKERGTGSLRSRGSEKSGSEKGGLEGVIEAEPETNNGKR